jgi:hypothetical protein
LKVVALSKSTLTPQTSLPFSAIKSKFLIGLTFRFMLRDIIFSSQRRKNQGVLQHPIRNLRRTPVYQEILQYSYQDYFEKFAIPYYWTRGLACRIHAFHHGVMRGLFRVTSSIRESHFKIIGFCIEPDFYFIGHKSSPAFGLSVR